MRTVLKSVLVTGLVALFALPAIAAEPRHYPRGSQSRFQRDTGSVGQFRLRLGLFDPEFDSNFWNENREVFTSSDAEDYRDVTFGGEFIWHRGQHLGLALGLETWQGEARQYYREEFISDLGHTSRVNVTPLTLGLYIYPIGRRGPVVPYIGVGGGLFFYRYREAGEFCEFNDPDDPDACDVIEAEFKDSGTVGGWFAVGGLDFPVSDTWSIFVEGRVTRAEATLGDDFENFGEIDLGGKQIAAGASFRF